MNATNTETKTQTERYGGHLCEDLPSMEALNVWREQQVRVAVVRKEFERTAMELLAARSLGRDVDALFTQLEVLQAVKAREEAALAEMLRTVR
jgi:hypothetical protein